MLRRALCAGTLLFTCACTTTPPIGTCSVIDASACPNAPSFTKDVLPVLDRACNSTCHAPGVGGPWPLTNYGDVNDWAFIVAADIEKCSMPPADASAGNGSLSDAERAMLLQWLVACRDDAGNAPNN